MPDQRIVVTTRVTREMWSEHDQTWVRQDSKVERVFLAVPDETGETA